MQGVSGVINRYIGFLLWKTFTKAIFKILSYLSIGIQVLRTNEDVLMKLQYSVMFKSKIY